MKQRQCAEAPEMIREDPDLADVPAALRNELVNGLPVSVDIEIEDGGPVQVMGLALSHGLAVHRNPVGVVQDRGEEHRWCVSDVETGHYVAGGETAAEAARVAMERIRHSADLAGLSVDELLAKARVEARRRLAERDDPLGLELQA